MVHKWCINADGTWSESRVCDPVQDGFFGILYSGRSAALNTTAGSSCPLLFSLQHTPNFFSTPPPLLSCLTCSSFCPVAEELVSWGEQGGVVVVVVLGPSGWRRRLPGTANTTFRCAINTWGTCPFNLEACQLQHPSVKTPCGVSLIPLGFAPNFQRIPLSSSWRGILLSSVTPVTHVQQNFSVLKCDTSLLTAVKYTLTQIKLMLNQCSASPLTISGLWSLNTW